MLKFNIKLQAIWIFGLNYLNTSYVKVQWLCLIKKCFYGYDLNTSYVKVQ